MKSEVEGKSSYTVSQKKLKHKASKSPFPFCALTGLIISGASLGSLYLAVQSMYDTTREVNAIYPDAASYGELQEARDEILVFDQDVNRRILTHGLPIDTSVLDQQKLQKARDALRLINQQDIAYQQREELRVKLNNNKSELRRAGEFAGISLGTLFAGAGLTVLFAAVHDVLGKKV